MMIDYAGLLSLEAGRWPTTAELYHSGCAQVPEERGVYFICAPPGKKIIFENRFWTPAKIPKRSTPYPAEVLEQKYARQGRPCLLYIGKAGGKKGLRQRLRQYIRHGWGELGNHLGGRAVWQIPDCQDFLVLWAVCPNPEQEEHDLLETYRRCRKDYPLANWRS